MLQSNLEDVSPYRLVWSSYSAAMMSLLLTFLCMTVVQVLAFFAAKRLLPAPTKVKVFTWHPILSFKHSSNRVKEIYSAICHKLAFSNLPLDATKKSSISLIGLEWKRRTILQNARRERAY